MKLIIIEGTDNTGKDTLISKIMERYPIVTVMHCGKPFSKKFSGKEQDLLFNVYADSIVNGDYDSSHVIIMNRSHIGEYVYGTLYRNRDQNEVADMILDIDNKLVSRKDLVVKYVQLVCTSEMLLMQNEDGKSLSNGDSKGIITETNKFGEIYQKSLLNKKMIKVNNEDKFRSREDIFNEVWKFIEN